MGTGNQRPKVPKCHRSYSLDGSAGATATLVEDPGGDDLLFVASRNLVAGDAVTRDYGRAPSLGFIDGSDADPASESEVLRRLLQFGIYPQWSS